MDLRSSGQRIEADPVMLCPTREVKSFKVRNLILPIALISPHEHRHRRKRQATDKLTSPSGILDRFSSFRISNIDIVTESRKLYLSRIQRTRWIGRDPRCHEIRPTSHTAKMDMGGKNAI